MPETDYERATAICRTMTDEEIVAEYSRGSDGVQTNAWRALDEAFRERGLRLRPWSDQSRILLSTASGIDGYRVTDTLDVVAAECVIGLIFLSDLATSLTDPAGGRSISDEPGIADARRKCLRELKDAAAALGADAVIAVNVRYTAIAPRGKEFLLIAASGTAVRLAHA